MSTKDKVEIFESKQDLARYFGKLLKEKTEKSNKVTIALSGGSTPKAIFDELAKVYAESIDWTKVYLFWGDERLVPPTNDESNYKMTVDHLLSKVSISKENIFRVNGELQPEEACANYEEVLQSNLPLVNGVPQFDIMLLGMGDDGHTASVFPYQIDLWDQQTNCVLAAHPESGQKRISLTGRVINQAKEIYFLVTGSSKAEKLDEILHQKDDYKKYPAALVKNPFWLLDKDAAQYL